MKRINLKILMDLHILSPEYKKVVLQVWMCAKLAPEWLDRFYALSILRVYPLYVSA
jgi:hypothetical protein